MSSSVWLKQVEDGLIAELRDVVKYRDENGKQVPINRVMVKKPESNFLDLTGDKEDIELPCVTVNNYLNSIDKKRFTSDLHTPQIISTSGSQALVEDKATPYKLFYQIDFWAEYEDDINEMTMTWLAKHPWCFNLNVVDNGGTERDCSASLSGTIQRSNSLVGTKRMFRAIINYAIRVEIDENNRYNTNIVKDVQLST